MVANRESFARNGAGWHEPWRPERTGGTASSGDIHYSTVATFSVSVSCRDSA